jgi:hypothetical protein
MVYLSAALMHINNYVCCVRRDMKEERTGRREVERGMPRQGGPWRELQTV